MKEVEITKFQPFRRDQMNVHKNAKQTPRALRKWVARFKADGVEGLIDRSSRPYHLRAVTPEPVVGHIISLRRLR